MGEHPKSKIEPLKPEKREAKTAKKRKVATKDTSVRFLIVYQGERTESNYFQRTCKRPLFLVQSKEIIGEASILRVFFASQDYKTLTPCTTIDLHIQELQHSRGNN